MHKTWHWLNLYAYSFVMVISKNRLYVYPVYFFVSIVFSTLDDQPPEFIFLLIQNESTI